LAPVQRLWAPRHRTGATVLLRILLLPREPLCAQQKEEFITVTLEKVVRYEAHLSRQLYKAMHELEALQARRMGGSVPLARLDIDGAGD
jgi:hypothetical protein